MPKRRLLDCSAASACNQGSGRGPWELCCVPGRIVGTQLQLHLAHVQPQPMQCVQASLKGSGLHARQIILKKAAPTGLRIDSIKTQF